MYGYGERCPDYDWEHEGENEFLCLECLNEGWILDGEQVVACPCCSEPAGDDRFDDDFQLTGGLAL